ncbi:hypothetical protein [Paraburkholderia youngii]|uniref:hypothetical protein n=1 Tax=Paraburkholderia youngii TaxID=2782701 RepID=UPI003D1E13C7
MPEDRIPPLVGYILAVLGVVGLVMLIHSAVHNHRTYQAQAAQPHAQTCKAADAAQSNEHGRSGERTGVSCQ